MPRSLPELTPGRHGVFTRAEAMAAGWTRSALQHAVLAGRLHRFGPGLYAAADGEPTFAARSVAAVLGSSASVASHASAAVLAGLPVWRTPARPCVTVAPGQRSVGVGRHVHRATLLPDTVVGRPSRTRSARTVVDLAREHGVRDALVAGDAALHEGLIRPADLAAVLTDCAGWPGIRRAETVIPLLDGRSESPLESVSRLVIAELGLPAPVPQVPILNRQGAEVARVDLYWPEFRVAGEVDGRSKYTDPQVWWDEKRRQERVEDEDVLVVRWGQLEIDHPPLLRAKLVNVFARAERRR